MIKAFKYRIYPNLLQIEQLKCIFGSVRYVYNLGLETKITAYVSARVNLSCFDLNKQITELKKTEQCSWLKICPSQALQMSLNNLDNAYTAFFKGEGFPKFKNKYSKQSFQLPQGVNLDLENNRIFIPKIKWVPIIIDRMFEGAIKTCTISKTTTDKYFISIQFDDGINTPIKPDIDENTTIGIDLGIKDLAILSDGTKFENPRWYQKLQKQLRIEQRTLSRRFKKEVKSSEQSNGYKKQNIKVAKIHEKIKNQRVDNLHKITTSITKKYNTIVLEDLNVDGMMKNHCLAKAIQDVSWSEFRRQLEYKTEWYGKNLLFIGRFEPSSKTCSNCGIINKELTLKDREWTCKCGVNHDRDINAANNIKNFGLRNKIKQV